MLPCISNRANNIAERVCDQTQQMQRNDKLRERLNGHKFRRQMPIDRFIVDFAGI